MNNTLHLSATTPALNSEAAPRTTPIATRFALLLQAVASAFSAPRDDPAALRYVASKYDGRGD